MGLTGWAWLGIALGSAASVAAVTSCGDASIEGDGLEVALPTRAPGDASADADAHSIPTAPAPDASSNGTDAVAPSMLCNASDLVLCFPFEDSVVDGSPNAIKPSEVTSVSFVAGKDGKAASLGATSAIRFGPSPAFELTTATI